jgi:DHA1 family bicyclomycin/chloramphenicol resistance-like MFS transporter
MDGYHRPRHVAGSRRIVALLLLIIPLSQIGLDIYTPALAQMAHEFGASNDLVQNTVTAYMLGMSVAFIPVRLIADALGRKKVLLSGLALLIVTSVGCALADSLGMLLVLRFVQGIGASACLLHAAAIAADCFRGAKLVSVLGLCGGAWGAAPVLAPAVGRCWRRPSAGSWWSGDPGAWHSDCSPSSQR